MFPKTFPERFCLIDKSQEELTEERWKCGTVNYSVNNMAKIYIFSGDDTVSSRKAYLDRIELFRKQNLEIIYVPAKEVSGELMENVFGSINLFGSSRMVATENFFSGQKFKEKDLIIKKILSFPQADFISWEEKEFTKAGGAKIAEGCVLNNFTLPKILWKFLDDLSPKNKIQNLQTFHKIISVLEPHFVFSMLIRQFRLLILAVDEEVDGLPPWQRSKLAIQAKEFGQGKLFLLYKQLLAIDIRQKTSSSAFDLSGELDLFIVNL